MLQLRFEDLRRDGDGQLVALRWPADTDKMGKAWVTPINATVRAAIDRILAERPGLGRAYLFPSPRNPAQPVSADLQKAKAAAVTAQKWPKQPPPDLNDWKLFQLVARHAGLVEQETYNQCDLSRDFRNLIHPGLTLRLGQRATRARHWRLRQPWRSSLGT